MKTIKIIGNGGEECNKLKSNTKIALEINKMEGEIEQSNSMIDMVTYGITSSPALVIDGHLISEGKITETEEIIHFLNNPHPSHDSCGCGHNH